MFKQHTVKENLVSAILGGVIGLILALISLNQQSPSFKSQEEIFKECQLTAVEESSDLKADQLKTSDLSFSTQLSSKLNTVVSHRRSIKQVQQMVNPSEVIKPEEVDQTETVDSTSTTEDQLKNSDLKDFNLSEDDRTLLATLVWYGENK